MVPWKFTRAAQHHLLQPNTIIHRAIHYYSFCLTRPSPAHLPFTTMPPKRKSSALDAEPEAGGDGPPALRRSTRRRTQASADETQGAPGRGIVDEASKSDTKSKKIVESKKKAAKVSH